MNNITIEPTEFTPQVVLDKDQEIFIIKGESRPENANEFFNPITKWLDEYYNFSYFKINKSSKESSKEPLYFTFSFDYFNSTSAKFILDIVFKIRKINTEVQSFHIKWMYDELDIDMKEAGEEFQKMVKDVTFIFKVNKD